jgi:hypothetical protein
MGLQKVLITLQHSTYFNTGTFEFPEIFFGKNKITGRANCHLYFISLRNWQNTGSWQQNLGIAQLCSR